jgi:hypothetical protein
MLVNPAAFDQHRQETAVEATRGAIVDVLDAGLLALLQRETASIPRDTWEVSGRTFKAARASPSAG